jgi:hydroxypyruvate reductase
MPEYDALLRRMFAAAIEAAQPAHCLPPHLPTERDGRLIVIGAGKGAAAMAHVVESHWQGPLTGVVVTRYRHAVPCQHIQVLEAGHPVPDANSVAAARAILQQLGGLTAADTVLCLLTGGGSSLLCLPPDGITLADKQQLNAAMLRSGMPISAINTVRRHVSAIKGGRLAAAAWPAQVLTLVISDVPGDALADIASGPTVADPTTCADALRALDQFGIAAGVAPHRRD